MTHPDPVRELVARIIREQRWYIRRSSPSWASVDDYVSFTPEQVADILANAFDRLSPQEEGWRPIESAPRDGTPIILGWHHPIKGWAWNRGAWHGRGWAKVGGSQQPPSHWHPLAAPPPPAGDGEGM
jgi:hypothetical protein